MIRRQVSYYALGALALGASVACSNDRATVLSPTGANSYGALLTPAASGNIPNGTIRLRKAPTAAVDSVRVTLAGLEPLTAGVYQVWLGNTNDTTATGFVKLTGSLTVIRKDTTLTAQGDPVVTDTTLSTTNGVSSFATGGPRTRMVLNSDATQLGVSPLTFNLVLVTVEADTNATQPGATRPLYRKFVAPTTTTAATSTLSFGNFDPRPDSQYVFVPVGRGTASFRGPEMVTLDSGLARPPIGYYYAVFALKRDTAGAIVDTVNIGELRAPAPRRATSLRDADISIVDPVVQAVPPSIRGASTMVSADTLASIRTSLGFVATAPYTGFSSVILSLQNKKGDGNTLSPAYVLISTVPGKVRFNLP